LLQRKGGNIQEEITSLVGKSASDNGNPGGEAKFVEKRTFGRRSKKKQRGKTGYSPTNPNPSEGERRGVKKRLSRTSPNRRGGAVGTGKIPAVGTKEERRTPKR